MGFVGAGQFGSEVSVSPSVFSSLVKTESASFSSARAPFYDRTFMPVTASSVRPPTSKFTLSRTVIAVLVLLLVSFLGFDFRFYRAVRASQPQQTGTGKDCASAQHTHATTRTPGTTDGFLNRQIDWTGKFNGKYILGSQSVLSF